VSAIAIFVILVILNKFCKIWELRLMVERVRVRDNINKAGWVEYFLVNKDVAAPLKAVAQRKILSAR